MAVLYKDIRLKSVIGNWYEYKPEKGYTNDFATANLDAAQIDELLEIHHKWGEHFGSLINQNLKISCGSQETSITKLRYGDMLSRAPDASVSFESATDPEFTVVLDNQLAYAFLDRAAGGAGTVAKKLNENLTSAEQALLTPLFNELLGSYRAYFLEAVPAAAVGEIFSPKLKQEVKLKKDDEVIVFSNTFYLAENKPAEIWFVYAEKSLDKLQEIYARKKEAKPKKITLNISPDSITNVKIPVNVKIGSTKVTVSDILNLVPGDVFQLGEKITDTLVMSVAEQGEFFVKLGSQRGNYAVKIVEHKPKYYNFAPPALSASIASNPVVESAPAPKTEAPAVQNTTPEAKPQVAASAVKEPVINSNIPVPRVLDEKPVPAVVEEQSVEYTDDGKVDAEKLELKDPLLDELPGESAESGDDFTWDIDDLK